MSTAAQMRAYRAQRKAEGFAGLQHGALSTYGVGCRCYLCTWANRKNMAAYTLRKQADGFAGLKHGAASTYGLGCRCEPCRAAATQRARRAAAKRRAS